MNKEFRKILSTGRNINYKDKHGNTVLHHILLNASKINNVMDKINFLLFHFIDLKSVNKNGNKLIHALCDSFCETKMEITKLLLPKFPYSDYSSENFEGYTPLFELCNDQVNEYTVEMAKLLLEHYPKIMTDVSPFGVLCCHELNEYSIEMAKLLLSRFDSKSKNMIGIISLLLLYDNYLNKYSIEMVKLLLQHCNISHNYKDKGIAFIKFCDTELNKYSVEMTKLLLPYCNVNFQNNYGETALIKLCGTKLNEYSIEMAKLLLPSSNVNSQNFSDGDNALCMLCLYELNKYSIEIAKLLLPYCDVNLQNHFGDIALAILCNADKNEYSIEMAKLLIPNSDNKFQDGEGNSVLTLLFYHKLNDYSFEIAKLLLSHIDINSKNNNGNTALNVLLDEHLNGDYLRFMELLVSHGADVQPSIIMLLEKCFAEDCVSNVVIDLIDLLMKNKSELKLKKFFLNEKNYYVYSDIHVDVLTKMLQYYDVNTQDSDGNTVLHVLCMSNSIYKNKYIKFFVNHDIDLDIMDISRKTAFDYFSDAQFVSKLYKKIIIFQEIAKTNKRIGKRLLKKIPEAHNNFVSRPDSLSFEIFSIKHKINIGDEEIEISQNISDFLEIKSVYDLWKIHEYCSIHFGI